MLPAMNSVVGKKIRKVAKGDLASEIILSLIRIRQIPLKHGPEAADPLFSLLHSDQDRVGVHGSTLSHFIQQLLMHMEKLLFGG